MRLVRRGFAEFLPIEVGVDADAGGDIVNAQHKTIAGHIRALPGSRQVRAIISTESADRVGDIGEVEGLRRPRLPFRRVDSLES